MKTAIRVLLAGAVALNSQYLLAGEKIGQGDMSEGPAFFNPFQSIYNAFSNTFSGQQDNFTTTMGEIDGSYWSGHWTVKNIPGCSGRLKILFFPMQKERFSGKNPTMSYRHYADVSQNLLGCKAAVGHFSPVNVGNCHAVFPSKRSPLEGDKNVPVRTIISKDGGKMAVISSPSCKNGKVERKSPVLEELKLSPDKNHLQVTIRIRGKLTKKVLGEFTYELDRHVGKEIRFSDNGRTRRGVRKDGLPALLHQPY